MGGIARKIAEGLFYSSLGNFLIKSFSVIGYIIIIRQLSIHDYGVFVLLTSMASPLSSYPIMGIGRLFVSNCARLRGGKNFSQLKGLIRDFYLASFLLVIIILIGVLFFKDILWADKNFYLLRYFYLICALGVSQLMLNLVLMLLEIHEKFREMAVVQIGESFFRSLLVISLISKLDISSVAWIYICGKLIACVVGAYWFFKILLSYRQTISEKGVLWRLFKTNGKWEMARNLLLDITTPAKVWVIKFFTSVQLVAVFDVAQNVYSFLLNILPIKTVIFPIISRIVPNRDLVEIVIVKLKKYSFFFYLVVFLVAIPGLRYALAWFAPQYLDNIIIFYLVLLQLFVEVYRLGQHALNYAFNAQKLLLRLFIFALLLEIILYPSLSYLFGIFGYVAAWQLEVLLQGFYNNWELKRNYNFKISKGWKYFFTFDNYDRLVLNKIKDKIRSYLPKFN